MEVSPSEGLTAGGEMPEHLADLGLLPHGGWLREQTLFQGVPHPSFCCGFVAGENISNIKERGNELHFR